MVLKQQLSLAIPLYACTTCIWESWSKTGIARDVLASFSWCRSVRRYLAKYKEISADLWVDRVSLERLGLLFTLDYMHDRLHSVLHQHPTQCSHSHTVQCMQRLVLCDIGVLSVSYINASPLLVFSSFSRLKTLPAKMNQQR